MNSYNAPMFGLIRNFFSVSDLSVLAHLQHAPKWISSELAGLGFADMARTILSARPLRRMKRDLSRAPHAGRQLPSSSVPTFLRLCQFSTVCMKASMETPPFLPHTGPRVFGPP